MTVGGESAVAIVSVIGGECSGKSTLSRVLADRLPGHYVVEELRLFVDEHGRPPRQDEQADVMARQIEAEHAAVTAADVNGKVWVVGDPAALMTAIYSIAYFNDESLLPAAIEHQSNYRLTIWCDVDLPWVEDGDQRDGPGERDRVHQIIGSVVDRYALDVCRVRGSVAERVDQVFASLKLSQP